MPNPAPADTAGAAPAAVRARIYRDGECSDCEISLDDVGTLVAGQDAVVWLDLEQPDTGALGRLADALGVHELAVEDACTTGERAKLDRYGDQVVLTVYAASLGPHRDLHTAEATVFADKRWMVTVRKDEGFPVPEMLQRWDAEPEHATAGGGFLLWGLLDAVVDGHTAVMRDLDDAISEIEDRLFAEVAPDQGVQRRSFAARKALVAFRRTAEPMREITEALLSHSRGVAKMLLTDELSPYLEDVHDHALRNVEALAELRDLVATILDTDETLRSDRLNEVTKKLTGWAAILILPTLVTGFYGMNTALYPEQNSVVGFWLAVGLIVGGCAALYLIFRSKDWL